METRASHFLIGAFTLAVIVGAFLFVLWLSKLTLDREFTEYEVIFREAITGLSVGGAVQYNGIQVGEVRRLYLAPQDPGQVIARVRVAAETPIKTDTRARLAITGLTGVAVIQLSGGTPQAARLTPAPDQTLAQIVADESALQRLLAGGEDVVTSLNEAIIRVTALLSAENIERVGQTLGNLEHISATLAARDADIDQLFSDLAESGGAIRRTLKETEALIVRLESVAANADRVLGEDTRELIASTRQTVESVRRLSQNTDALIAENRDAVSSFTNQSLGQIAPALAELRSLLRELTRVAERIDEDPAAFLGGQDKPQEFRPK
ncbi:MAG TPA: MlaD family protein [Xanthomonadaceae bacterium]|nr:MlaD family protein [Xanthomonadaceae bacterium]